ncbi:Rieske (2Fe-2S) protein [Porticoccus sp. W117]|uniref:Rieske (2Fe-2S) protein n=1 Tax=Porticoccus sp. W117 TaxID=3054777 RepID=UPI002594AC7B|nr:Rieske (2Fe-2S) protein [Porticoccus sp. W117]MDM3872579.1 Rieske (2Fe-2S) protein [Porticoccus sp. W117]
MPELETELCQLEAIPDGGSKEFYPNGEALFAVRQGSEVFVYRNSCPHTGMPLNWQPDRFFDVEKKFIQCAVHAAIFQPDTGLCVAGPCSGESLTAIPCEVKSGSVFVHLPTSP